MAYAFFNVNGNLTDYIQGTTTLFTYPFTINFWFYPTISGLGTMQMVVLHNTVDNQRHAVQINTTTSRLIYNAFTTTNALATAGANYTLNAWNMATAVGTSSTSRTIYINGGNSVTNTTARAITTPTRWLLASNYSTSVIPTYEGRVAELGIWNIALSTDDITSLYTGQKPTMIRPDSLKVYVPLVRDILDNKEATSSITSTITDTTVVDHVRRYG